MLPPVKLVGNVVAVATVFEPMFKLDPALTDKVPVAFPVTWKPPSLKILFGVTSPTIRLRTVIVEPEVTPAALLIFRIPRLDAPPKRKTFWAEEPLRLMVLVAGGVVNPPPTAPAPLSTLPPIFIVPAPAISIW